MDIRHLSVTLFINNFDRYEQNVNGDFVDAPFLTHVFMSFIARNSLRSSAFVGN